MYMGRELTLPQFTLTAIVSIWKIICYLILVKWVIVELTFYKNDAIIDYANDIILAKGKSYKKKEILESIIQNYVMRHKFQYGMKR